MAAATTRPQVRRRSNELNKPSGLPSSGQEPRLPGALVTGGASWFVATRLGQASAASPARPNALETLPPQGPKEVLADVWGIAQPGEMQALLGPSGAGKSTFMDILAMRKSVGTLSGRLLVNGSRASKRFIKKTAYVPQEDNFVPTMTTWEVMSFYAEVGAGANSGLPGLRGCGALGHVGRCESRPCEAKWVAGQQAEEGTAEVAGHLPGAPACSTGATRACIPPC